MSRHNTKNDDDTLKRSQEEAQRQTEADNRARDDARRSLLDFFRLWRLCPDKRCERARGCRGDTGDCFRDRWSRHVPAAARALIGKSFEFARGGMPWREAVKAASADMEMRRKIMARYDVKMPELGAPLPASILRHMKSNSPAAIAPPAAPVPEAPAAPPHRGPRVRGL